MERRTVVVSEHADLSGSTTGDGTVQVVPNVAASPAGALSPRSVRRLSFALGEEVWLH